MSWRGSGTARHVRYSRLQNSKQRQERGERKRRHAARSARGKGGQYDGTNDVELKGAGNEAGTVCKRQEACCTLSCSPGPGEGDGWVDSVSPKYHTCTLIISNNFLNWLVRCFAALRWP